MEQSFIIFSQLSHTSELFLAQRLFRDRQGSGRVWSAWVAWVAVCSLLAYHFLRQMLTITLKENWAKLMMFYNF